jgi:putative ABC transport system substrate-binding protein
MKRRSFIALLGGAAASAWPRAASAQKTERIWRLAVMMGGAENDPEIRRRVEALVQGLRELGWAEGRNIRFDYRFGGGDNARMLLQAREIVESVPDAIVVQSTPFLTALRQVDRTIPTVAAQAGDLVNSGFVTSLARPGGNLTGFTTFEPEIGGKWLQILKEIAPGVTRALVLFDPTSASNIAYARTAQAAASSVGVAVIAGGIHAPGEIEPAIDAFAAEPNGGLLVLPSPLSATHRERIIALAARNRLPAVYAFRFFVESGGLASYGVDNIDMFRRAAAYVDRIFKGAKPADLPVQQPTRYELIVNLKAAKAIGLTIPESFLIRADEVIE